MKKSDSDDDLMMPIHTLKTVQQNRKQMTDESPPKRDKKWKSKVLDSPSPSNSDDEGEKKSNIY